jgi:hypothetical protein
VKSQVRRNKNATLKKILPHCAGQLSFAPMPSFMDSGPAETGFQGMDRNAPPPPSHFVWKAYFLRIFLGNHTEAVEVKSKGFKKTEDGQCQTPAKVVKI